MVEYLKRVLTAQFEAALSMLNQCVKACKPDHWEGKIANGTFRQVTYHTLFFVDLYLSKSAEAFELRELHHRGGDERNPTVSPGLSQEETLDYIQICRAKAIKSLAAETRESLEGPSGFRASSRGEFHVYNIRHIQHHTGQLSAYLRRVDPTLSDHKMLTWVGTGWR